jgi:hypothetical protein
LSQLDSHLKPVKLIVHSEALQEERATVASSMMAAFDELPVIH